MSREGDAVVPEGRGGQSKGVAPSGPGLRPSGAEPAAQSQAEPLVPNAGCRNCDSMGWVCEDHPDRPWGGTSAHAEACHCGGAGAPCPVCRPFMAFAHVFSTLRRAQQRIESMERDTNWNDGDWFEDTLPEQINEVWSRYDPAKAMSASGQDPKGLEGDSPASAVGAADAPDPSSNPSPDTPQ